MHEAMLWEDAGDNKVHCLLCRHHCRIAEGKTGICQVRENQGGKLYSLVYDKVIAQNIDPVEKKPLYHFLPGSKTYSIATPGCNFRCLFCQNADIAQMPRDSKVIVGQPVSPQEIVDEALRAGCKSISYTYTEPTIFFELAYDTAVLAHENGLKNIFVTNGYITPEALSEIAPYLDAANIDLKGFTPEFYRTVCGAELEEVLESIKLYHELGIWTEITTLIIPGHNDSKNELHKIAHFISTIDRDIPWHVTRFHPAYKLTDQPSTPVATLRMAMLAGFEEGLRYVYEGNIPGTGGEETYCPGCRRLLIKRYGFQVSDVDVRHGHCCFCGHTIAGVWG
jgi:pyruvate formate lyase activating enzyme